MTFETYQAIFCLVAGILVGTGYFVFKVLSGVGEMGGGYERNEEGEVKIFSPFNLGLVATATTIGMIFATSREGSYAHIALMRSWNYFFDSAGLFG